MVECLEVIRIVGMVVGILADMSGLVPPRTLVLRNPAIIRTLLMTSCEDEERTTTVKISLYPHAKSIHS